MLPRNHGQFWISTFGPNYQLVVRLYDLIVTFSCCHLLHTFAPRKHVIWGVMRTENQQVQWSIAPSQKIAARHGPDRDLRTLWEFYETSMLRLQLLYGNLKNFIVVAGEILKYKRSPATKQKDDYDFSSIPGYNIIKKNSSREPKHGRSERQIVLLKAKDMQRAAKKNKNGNHPTLLSRWQADEEHRKSLEDLSVSEKKKSGCTTKSLWRDTTVQLRTNTRCKALGYLDKCWRTSTTSTTTPRLCRSKKRMSVTTRRVYGANKAALQTNSCKQTNASKSDSAIRRKWRLWSRRWSENKMEMVQRAAGKPAAYFVFVVLIMAKLEFVVVAFFKAWRRAVSEKNFQHAVSDCRNVVPTIRRRVYTEHTPVAFIMNNTVFSQARTWNACLWLKLDGSGLQRHHCAHEKSLSFRQPCHLLAGLYLTFSLPVHHNTKHHLDSTTHFNYESGGNPRTNTPTGYQLEELAITSGSSLEDIHRLYDVQREFEEQDQQAPTIEELKEFGVSQFIQTQSLLDHEMAETSPVEKMSYLQSPKCTSTSLWKALRTLISKLEIQKLLTSPLYAQRASGKPDVMVFQERE